MSIPPEIGGVRIEAPLMVVTGCVGGRDVIFGTVECGVLRMLDFDWPRPRYRGGPVVVRGRIIPPKGKP